MNIDNLTLRSRLLLGFGPMLLILGFNTAWAAASVQCAAKLWITVGGVAGLLIGVVSAWWLTPAAWFSRCARHSPRPRRSPRATCPRNTTSNAATNLAS